MRQRTPDVRNIPVIKLFFQSVALGPLCLRGGMVGVNFLIMLGLAAHLGLTGFGRLAFLWSLVLFAGTCVSCGIPLVLLRIAANGCRPQTGLLIGLVWGVPAGGLIMLYAVGQWVAPDQPWLTLTILALAINAITCLASLLRGAGSVNGSMVLRDAAPQLALGAAALCGAATPAGLLAITAIGLLVLAGLLTIGVLLWMPVQATTVRPKEASALWGTSVAGVGVAQMDLILGGLIFAPEVLGLYALLKRIANLVALPVTVATWVGAGPIARAAAARDTVALQAASLQASRVALWPGMALTAVGFGAVALLPQLVTVPAGAGARGVFAVLIIANLVQVWLAAGMPVATLSGLGSVAFRARLLMLGVFLAGAAATALYLTPLGLAVLTAAALSLGGLWLRARLQRELGVETSAAALWPRGGARWKHS